MVSLGIQKALHLYKEEAKRNPKLNGLYMASIKKDGWYVYADYIIGRGWSDFHSRTGRIIPSLQNYKKHLISLPQPKEDCRIIKEAIIPGLKFHTLNGILNRSTGNYQAEGVQFYVHDYVPLRTYHLNLEINYALNRYEKVKELIGVHHRDVFIRHELLFIAAYHKQFWLDKFHKVIDDEEEGLVFKREDSLYSPDKRNSDLLKMKMEDTFDLLCVKMYWTKGDKGNDNLNLDLQNKAGIIVPVRIGKFSDIAEFQINSPVGKVVCIKAMCKLPDGSYREPRYSHIRFDKLSTDID